MMKKTIPLIIALFIFTAISLSHAEIKTFVKEYTYQASELDSKSSCKAIATEQLKRTLLEELGTYVESKTIVKDSQLDKDEITTLTAGVVQLVVMDEKWDGKVYWLKAQVKADPDEVAASIDKLRNDEQLMHDLEEARAEAAQAMEEAEALRQQLAQTTADKQKQEQYNETMNQLVASDYFERGSAFNAAGNYGAAANAYNQAIMLQPEYAKAYINRSIIYVQLGIYGKAANDLKMAAALNPAKEDVYYNRVEQKKRARDLQVSFTRQNTASTQGVRGADPLQKLLDWKREERRKAYLRGSLGKSVPIHAEPSRNTAHGGSYNKETDTSRPGLESKAERNNQALKKERELRRKQRVEEIRKKKSMKRHERKKEPERERDREKK
ncbi:MAG: tetratricopeptide repeat protein [Syntrophales bacterium]